MGYAMDDLHALDLALFAIGTFAAAFVTGLAGFAFAMAAAAVWLHFLAPSQAAPLIGGTFLQWTPAANMRMAIGRLLVARIHASNRFLIAEPARQPRALVRKRALTSTPTKLRS